MDFPDLKTFFVCRNLLLLAESKAKLALVFGLDSDQVEERSLGGEPRSGDLFEPNSLARAAEGAEGGESTRRRRFLSPRSLRPQTGK